MNYKRLLTIATATVMPLALVSCGKETVIKEVLVTIPPTTAAQSEPVEQNKYDKYLDFVLDNSGQAREWKESDLIETATLVCGAFDGGASLSGVVGVFSDNSTGSYDDELFAAIIGGAVTYICPEWASYVDSQLS